MCLDYRESTVLFINVLKKQKGFTALDINFLKLLAWEGPLSTLSSFAVSP